MDFSNFSLLLVLALGYCMSLPLDDKPENSQSLKRIARSPDADAEGENGGSVNVEAIRQEPENPKNYEKWGGGVSPGIQGSVDKQHAKRKQEGDEIEKIGDKSKIHEVGGMMEKGQYDVMQKNFQWASDQFSGIKMNSDGSTSGDAQPKGGGGGAAGAASEKGKSNDASGDKAKADSDSGVKETQDDTTVDYQDTHTRTPKSK